MARIPEEELERLKLEVDLAALVRSKGIELKPHGENLVGCCPFHDDRTPSLVITPSKNLWHCMGACSVGGSVIDWVMKAEGVSFRHAVELLREGGAAALLKTDSIRVKATIPRLALPVDPNGDEQKLLHEIMAYYKETLKKSPEAIDYLKSRKIYNEEAIEKFSIGYSDRSLGLRLPHKNRANGQALRFKLNQLGLYRSSGHEHFRGSVVFPVTRGQAITEVYGRKTRDDLREGTAYHIYLPGPHKGIWNEECLSSPEVILCESIIDALSFWCHGFKNVTASYGVDGFTDDHLDLFLRHGVGKVLIAYDRDEAGDRGAEKVAALLSSEGIECWRIEFPKTMDANEYVQKMTPEKTALEVVVQKAVLMQKRKKAPPIARPEPVEAAPEPLPPVAVSFLEAVPEPELVEAPEEQAPAPASATEEAPYVPEQPIAPGAKLEVPTEIKGEDVLITLGDREYRVRGLKKNQSYEVLRVNLRAGHRGVFYVDTIDLYNAKARVSFVNSASEELELKPEVIKRDLGRVLGRLEDLQADELGNLVKEEAPMPVLRDEEKIAAIELLRDPKLVERILADFKKCGVVGEETNKLVSFLAAVSRKLDDPLAVLIQSSSAAGKSSLMEAVLAMIPEEERIKFSAMTGQSLFYMGETNLKNKILAIAEEEGASEAAYALKLLQSEGEISIASTGKDPQSGRLVTHEYRVEGPVMIFLTTTAIDIDEELLNRCLVLTVNESREQTEEIHRQQRTRETLQGIILGKERDKLLVLHKNAQRLLQSLKVANPFAEQLTFLSSRTRARRDHKKYLTLIRAIALLHQYQRPRRTVEIDGEIIEYIEVVPEDIALANRLCHEVLGRSLDELPPQTRRLLGIVQKMVEENSKAQDIQRSEYRFSRKDVRDYSGWGDTQVHVHMDRLQGMEYLVAHRGGRGQSFLYELLFDGKTEKSHMMGLVENVAQLTPRLTDLTQHLMGSIRPQFGPESGGYVTPEIDCEAATDNDLQEIDDRKRRNAALRALNSRESYV